MSKSVDLFHVHFQKHFIIYRRIAKSTQDALMSERIPLSNSQDSLAIILKQIRLHI